MLAGLSRGLARWTAERVRDGEPRPTHRPEWLAVATWRASRFGLAGELFDPASGASVPAERLVRRFTDLVGPHIGTPAEQDAVATVDRVLASGNSATRQRRAFSRRRRVEDVTDHLARETIDGWA